MGYLPLDDYRERLRRARNNLLFTSNRIAVTAPLNSVSQSRLNPWRSWCCRLILCDH